MNTTKKQELPGAAERGGYYDEENEKYVCDHYRAYDGNIIQDFRIC